MGVLTIDGHTIDTNEPIPFTLATKEDMVNSPPHYNQHGV